MSDLINNIGAAAGEWNRHFVWIAVNVGYIAAELPHIEEAGCDTEEITEWLQSFPYLEEIKSKLEIKAYIATRLAEVGSGDIGSIQAHLDSLQILMSKWIQGLDDLVQQAIKDEAMPAVMMLTSCGGEILEAHQGFLEQLKSFHAILKYMPVGGEEEEASEAVAVH